MASKAEKNANKSLAFKMTLKYKSKVIANKKRYNRKKEKKRWKLNEY